MHALVVPRGVRTSISLSLGFRRFFGSCLFCGAGWEVEADFAVFDVEREVGVELAFGAVRDEALDDVGLTAADQLEDLVFRDGALEDGFADADAVRVFFGDEFGDVVGFFGGVNFVRLAGFGVGVADELFFGEFRWSVFFIGVEDEVHFEFGVEFEAGIEGFVKLGFETGERTDVFGGEELDGFGFGEWAAGDVFFRFEFAFRFAAFVGRLGLFEAGSAAHRAGDFKVVEDFAFGEISGFAGVGADLIRVGDDFLHEIAALQVALLHLAEFEFPIAGEFRRVEALDIHFPDEVDEAHACAGDVEFATFAGEVFLGDKPLDDCGAGGGSAEAALGHCIAEGFVVDEFSGAFHGGEQGGLGHAGGRFGFLREHFDGFDAGGLAGGDGAEFVFAGGDTWAAAVDFEPAGFDEDTAFGFEAILVDVGEAGGLLEFGGWVEHGDEALDDHVVELLFGFGEFGDLAGGDDGEVI